jgi:hypothetical protein
MSVGVRVPSDGAAPCAVASVVLPCLSSALSTPTLVLSPKTTQNSATDWIKSRHMCDPNTRAKVGWLARIVSFCMAAPASGLSRVSRQFRIGCTMHAGCVRTSNRLSSPLMIIHGDSISRCRTYYTFYVAGCPKSTVRHESAHDRNCKQWCVRNCLMSQ